MPTRIPIFRSELQAAILQLVLLNPERQWTAPNIVERLSANPVTVHRELRRAVDEGLLLREPLGRSYLYSAATDSPLYEPLRTLLERTVGVEPELRKALGTLPGVEGAFLHGSFARGGVVRPTSDVDVLVLGAPDPHALRKRLREVERRIGREIDVLAYEPTEFSELAKSGNSLARDVLRGPVIALVGSADDLPASA
jgi:predicted nucleotidyltransferase